MNLHSILFKTLSRRLRLTLYPRPFEQFNPLRGAVGVEVGVLGGDHALSLLKCGVAILHLVDPYLPYCDFDSRQMELARGRAERVLRNKPVIFHRTTSLAASQNLRELDFIYIDAAHDYESVKSDISAWWPEVKIGGVMGGHDFDNGTHACHDGVVQAVTEFSVSRQLQLLVETPDWWIRRDV